LAAQLWESPAAHRIYVSVWHLLQPMSALDDLLSPSQQDITSVHDPQG
jgi:hypothetical protein